MQSVGYSFMTVIVAGLIATALMSLCALSFRRMGVLHVSSIRAIGSSVTGSLDHATSIGWGIHFLFGVLFAFVYRSFVQVIGMHDPINVISFCGLIGALHGVVVGFILVISIAEYHPMQRYREEGMGMAGVYFVAHVIYGIAVGAVLALGMNVAAVG